MGDDTSSVFRDEVIERQVYLGPSLNIKNHPPQEPLILSLSYTYIILVV